ncbi:MAG: family 43 glycosylhydrolase [Bacilli bacterium]|nr:family 43 glycosylhydrolase [Bacilli bacterium]
MKNKLPLLISSAVLLLVGCNQAGTSSNPSAPDQSVPVFTSSEGEDTLPSRPVSVTLPNEGDAAPDCLEFDGELVRFDNKDLHEDDSLMPAKWANYGVHSPYIFKAGDTYYLYSSTPDRSVGVRAYKSKDLKHWEFAQGSGLGMGYLVKDKKSGNAKAPKVLLHKGKYYLYFNNGNGYQVYEGETPEGPFSFSHSLGDNSMDEGYIFKADGENCFFFGGGEDGIYVYEMDDDLNVDSKSKTLIEATKKSSFSQEERSSTAPFVIEKDGYLILSFSRIDEDFASFRSYTVAALDADFTSASSLAASFVNNRRGPVLLNTEDEKGYVGTGHLSFVEGTDLSSTYGVYTTLDHEGVRSLNIDPVSFAGPDIMMASRKEGSIGMYAPSYVLSGYEDEGKILSDVATESNYTATFSFTEAESALFSYSSRNKTFFAGKQGESMAVGCRENGLVTTLYETPFVEGYHQVKVETNDGHISVSLDGSIVVNNWKTSLPLNGKIGYEVAEDYEIGYTAFTNSNSKSATTQTFVAGESTVYGGAYLKESNLNKGSGTFVETRGDSSFQGNEILRLANNRDFARYALDVKEAGRYAVELTINYDFAYYGQSVGVRVGKNSEIIYPTKNVGGNRYVRVLGPEFNVEKGLNEVFIENLSKANLDLASFRLVPVSETAPMFESPLESFEGKGISYLTDFIVEDDFELQKSVQTYEGVNNFAYVGDDTITDFRMQIKVAISSLPNPNSAILLGFRCGNYCSSSADPSGSMTGYVLAIGPSKMTLRRSNYGEDVTLASVDRTLSTKEYFVFEIAAIGNTISVYKDDTRLMEVTDPFAISSGHLGFGTTDASVFFHDLVVSGGQY